MNVTGVLPSLLSRAGAIASRRTMTVVAGPPRVKVSSTEKAIHGIVMTLGFLAVPGWVLLHIRQYRGLE